MSGIFITVFALQPRRYATERLKIAYVITLLTAEGSRVGGQRYETQGASFCNVFDDFRCEMTRLFDTQISQGGMKQPLN